MDKKKDNNFAANDLVAYNNSKEVGVVLQVQEDNLKLFNEQGQVKNIKLSDISKKFEKNRKAFAADNRGNTLSVENVVKCVDGRYKGRKGVVKHIHKNTLFLWDKEFTQTNGLFVE